MSTAAGGKRMLKSVPLFSLMSDEQFASLLPAIQRRSFLSRSLIMRAGENADGLFVILSGRVRVLIDNGESREFIVGTLGPNEFFGEMGLIDGGASPVTIESQEPCEVVYIPRKRLLECLRQNAAASMFILRSALARLREAHHKMESLALMSVYGRVARVLIENAHESAGECHVDLGTEQIAAMVGASREMVSRVLKEMTQSGAIRRSKRKLVVLDRAAVAERTRPRGCIRVQSDLICHSI
jgi:CRP/FNR family cyclic AMP-dependent transcriptional regulator